MSSQFTLGWEEWVSIPELGLPAIKAKVDTGARTSSLHAVAVEPFGPLDNPHVRFVLHPIPNKPEIEVVCSAPAVDRREVTSSNGDRELRWVIETELAVGERRWPVELTLANRETMAYRMLLGRRAIQPDMIVNPTISHAQPDLSYDLYKDFPRRRAVRRPLRIAILTREPRNYSSMRLRDAAEARGHVAEMIDTSRCTLAIDSNEPNVFYDGEPLPEFDAVIPRIGASLTRYGMAVLRQLSMMGAFCLNTAEAVGASRDKLYAHQVFARHRIGMPMTAFADSPKDTANLIDHVGGAPLILKLLESTQGRGVVLAETRKAAESVIDAFRGLDANFIVQDFVKEAEGTDIRCFVVGGRVVASMMRQAPPGSFKSNLHQGGKAKKVRITKEERHTAVRAAKALGLAIAGVDLLRSTSGPKVIEVNSSPGLEGVERSSGKDVAGMVIEYIETHVKAATHRVGRPV